MKMKPEQHQCCGTQAPALDHALRPRSIVIGKALSQGENYLGSNNMSACKLNIGQKSKRVKL
jgi:hypothetical protein